MTARVRPLTNTAQALLSWPWPVRPEDVVCCAVWWGQPLPKERARVVVRGGKARGVTPQRSREYEQALRLLFAAERELRPPDELSPFGVRLWFFRRGKGRCDLDNLEKAVLDAAKGAVWGDDTQVRELHSRLVLGAAAPRVELVIHRLRGEQP